MEVLDFLKIKPIPYGAGHGRVAVGGSGTGYKIKILNANEVHYVDNIPCIFHSIKGNIAKVTIINQWNYQDEGIAYIAKNDYFFAHGKSIREAVEALNAKYYATLDTEGKIVEFKKLFQNGAVDVKTLHTWHGILTGSCELGRSQFQKEHGLSDDDTLTIDEFIALTKNAYGSAVIEKIKGK